MDEMASAKTEADSQISLFGNALETLDRFLQNETNLVVQFLISLETMTNISRRYLARAFLTILFSYFMFSNFVLDLIAHLLLFLYPSYRTYLLLKRPELSKEDLTDLVKFWIFVGLFSTLDFILFSYLIPFYSILKFAIIIQCVLPRKSPSVEFAFTHIVSPLFEYIEHNQKIRILNDYFRLLSNNLEENHLE